MTNKQAKGCSINNEIEIINAIAKLNDTGKSVVLSSIKGLLMNAYFCETGKTVNLFYVKVDNRKRKDVFKQIDKLEMCAIVDLSAHIKASAVL